VQLCPVAGTVVTTGTAVRVGVAVTGGKLPEVHPLTIMKPAITNRRMINKPKAFRAMIPDITGNIIIIV
jgi:hypothetical protein